MTYANDRLDRFPCMGFDGISHRCGVTCLPIVARTLPVVAGWRWRYGATGGGWSVWLEEIGGDGAAWFVLDCPSAATARELVGIIYAYGLGADRR